MAEEFRFITDDMSDVDTLELMDALPNYFSLSEDVEHTAYLNWRFDFTDDIESHFFSMGKGYFETLLAPG